MDWGRAGRQFGFLVAFALLGYAFRALMRRLAERDRWHVALIVGRGAETAAAAGDRLAE